MIARRLVILSLTVLLGIWFGVASAAEVTAPKKPDVFVSIEPVEYFVKRVAGPLVDVNVLVGPGQEPHTFEPTPKLVAKLSDAQVLFKIGFPFEEALIAKAGSTFKNLKVVDLQQGIKMRTISDAEEESDHDAGASHGHSHEAGAVDPHTWLDPRLAKIQARTIAATLIEIDPIHRAVYEENLKRFQSDLDKIDDQLRASLAPLKGKSFFVFHPAFGYLGDEYGLKQVAVEIEGKEPTARQLSRLIEQAKRQGVRVIFAEPQFPKKTAETLAKSIGGAVVLIDDLAPDYMNNLKDVAMSLESALRNQAK
ncbi:MAG: zinc ABC transporter substrate-binding protein [Deltaproteobacteria bacterium]|nr:zinc ABC transporter substrate-binding protein [Deltaproteobacteria bacterium]